MSALFFYQGENDTLSYENASTYKDRFESFLLSFREDFGHVPVIFAQLASNTKNYKFWDLVKQQQAMINLPNSYMVKTDSLSLNVDGIHLNSESLHQLGAEMAMIYLKN